MFAPENSFVKSEELEDTHPILTQDESSEKSSRHDKLGLLCLIGATLFTLATVVLFVMPNTSSPAEVDNGEVSSTAVAAIPTLIMETPLTNVGIGSVPTADMLLATLSPQEASQLLSTPPFTVTLNSLDFTRNVYDPFTFIPDRARTETIQYSAVTGDTMGAIAERFGLQPETLAWSNPRSYIQILQPGNVLNIPPVDGVYYAVLVEETIGSIAEQYNVDPYAIIDSEFNNLFGTTPETQLPSGTRVVVEGGVGEQIAWSPQVVRVASGGSGGNTRSGGQISFSPGDPGSCGLVDNPGGGSGWVRPINGYTWIRGYASWHPAADLAVREGTTVAAANSGRVIFAGWNTFGYGYAVVLAHGPFTTIYAHLSAISVGCGQDVSAGQVIGASGNSGNSSGPHLHFELRYNDVPQDPTYTVAL